MAEDTPARDRRVFAPTPQRVAFVIRGIVVETDLYSFLDLPMKDALAVYALEDEMKTATGGWPALVEYMRRLLRLLCPSLLDEDLDALTPRQLQEALGASHGVTDLPPPGAEADPSASSASASSTTTSP